MAKRDRLGRGLGALLGEYLGEERIDGVEVREVPLGSITPNPFQPRREFEEGELADLTESIRENGLLQPIVLRPASDGSDALWELVAGERRWRAVTRLGWKHVPAIIREVDDRTLLVLSLVENIQRAQLSPLEEAEAYRRLADEFGLSQAEIADTVGRDRSTVANTLRLLQLPASVRRMLSTGDLTAGHARALLGLAGDARLADLARRAVEEEWSVRHTEARVKAARGEQKPKKRKRRRGANPERDAAERRLEEVLQRQFGAEVRIRRGRGSSGRVELPFLDEEDFARLFELLTDRSVEETVS